MRIDDFSWDDLRVLLAVHRQRSLFGAGRVMGLSTSTTARRLDRLEAQVGRRLVMRSTSGTRVEPGAMELVRLAEQLDLGLGAASRRETEFSGIVRVSAGDGFAAALAPVLGVVRRLHPGLIIELIAEARVADVAKGEADVGVRTARSASAVLVEKPIGRLSFGLYASRRFVEERLRRTELTLDDIAQLDVVAHSRERAHQPQNAWLAELGATKVVFQSNSDAVLLAAAAEADQGLIVLADLVGASNPKLVRLTTPHPGPKLSVWLAFHRDCRTLPRVRVVVDAIEAAARAAF